MSSASPRPQKRTAQTCVTCRARKVRCDGRKGVCTNCDRLGLPCTWDETFAVEGILVPSTSMIPTASQQQQQQGLSLIADPRLVGANNNTNTSPTATPPLLIPRRRARQACQNCHSKKARCSGSTPSCDRCRVQGLECVYRPGKRALVLPASSSTTLAGASQQQQALSRDQTEPQDVIMQDDNSTASLTQSAAASPNQGTPSLASPPPSNPPPLAVPSVMGPNSEPPESLVMQAFEHFFKHVHHIPSFSFLHRASLMERYTEGKLDRCLLLALVGVTLLLTDLRGQGQAHGISDTEEYGRMCIEEAASICLSNIEKPTILLLQALVIVVKHRLLSKQFQGAFLLFSLASRIATVVRLNHENPSVCFLAQESRRRLMWSIYLIDCALSNGQLELSLWPRPETQIHLNLPTNERRFELDLAEVTEPLIPPPFSAMQPSSLPADPESGKDAMGILGLYIRMYHMRTKILSRTMQVLANVTSPAELANLPSLVAGLTAELEAFEARLLPSFKYSESSLKLRSYSPRLGIFFMTHIWWRQCHLDLYRLFLPGLKEALGLPVLKTNFDLEFVVTIRRKCYDHAKSMADMFAQLLSPSISVPITDTDLAGCAYQCVRVLYHGLQTWGTDIGFKREWVEDWAAKCLRAVRAPTEGTPAGRAILADIERVMREGVKLGMGPAGITPATGMVFSSLGGSGSGGGEPQTSSSPATATRTSPGAQVPVTGAPAPMAFSPPTASQNLPNIQQQHTGRRGSGQVERPGASVAPSHSSVLTTGSNAFEESLDDLASFGPDFFTDDAWAATLASGGNMMSSNDWLDSMSMQLPPPPPPPPPASAPPGPS